MMVFKAYYSLDKSEVYCKISENHSFSFFFVICSVCEWCEWTLNVRKHCNIHYILVSQWTISNIKCKLKDFILYVLKAIFSFCMIKDELLFTILHPIFFMFSTQSLMFCVCNPLHSQNQDKTPELYWFLISRII